MADEAYEGGKGKRKNGSGSYEVHMAFARWHMMLAEVESMAEENWAALISGREREFPEWKEGARLLHQAAEGFRGGAAACLEALREARGDLERGYINADVKMLESLASSIDEMAGMMENGEVPSIDQVHRIEDMLREQHMAMDRKTSAIGAVERIKGGG